MRKRIFIFVSIAILIVIGITIYFVLSHDNDRYIFDEEIDKIIIDAGMNPKNLEHVHELDNYYSKTFEDKYTDNRYLIVSELPYLDRYGNTIDIGWEKKNETFVTKENTFYATVIDNSITITTDFDDFLSFSPTLYYGTEKVLPKSYTPTLLKIDPLNSYYNNNVLVWDYGICKRYVRIIEGKFLGFWEFNEIPSYDITIKYNQIGDFRLNIGAYSLDDDTEYISVEDFEKLSRFGYPLIIGDTLTVYPDSSADTCDGGVYVDDIAYDWADLHDKTDGSAADTATTRSSAYISAWGTTNNWGVMSRVFASFDTSSIPVGSTINSGTITIYGRMKYNNLGVSPELNVYGSTQADSDTLVVGDYSNGGTLAFSTDIAYADYNFNTAAPAANTFSLNGDGLDYINKGGTTDFCFREVNYDVGDTAPAWSAWQDLGFTIWMSDQGVGYKPTLVIKYDLATTEIVFDNPSTDGYVTWDYDTNTVWDTIHDGNGLSHVTAYPSGDWIYPVLQYWTSNGFNMLGRGIISYDTSDIPNDATITSAYFSLYVNGKVDQLSLTPLLIVGTISLDSTSTIIASDYNYLNYGITSLGSIAYASVVTGTYNTISLNATGLAAISKTGNSSFSFRLDNDFDDDDPGGGFSSYNYSAFFIATEERTGGAYKPKLIVNYSGGSSDPSVITATPISIEETTATGVGNITDAGSGIPSFRGFCWSESDPPTIADSGTQEVWAGATGTYSMTIDSLTSGTHYYVRAYALHDSGTGYGSSEDIHTKPNPVTDLTVDDYSTTSGTLSWSAPAGGLTGYYVRYNTGTYPAAYTEGSEWYTGSNISAGKTGLNDNTTYYISIWSYFTDSPNAGGVSDTYDTATFTTDAAINITTESPSSIEETTATATGVISSIGTGTPSSRGFCWSSTDPPTVLDSEVHEAWAGATGTYSMSVTGLTAGNHYYIRAYATDSLDTFYGDSENIYTKPNPVTDLSEQFAGPSGFSIEWTAPGSVTGYYARYKEGSYPTDYTDGSAMTVSGASASIGSLSSETEYYVRVWSYFTNSPNAGGVADSYDEVTVTTSEDQEAIELEYYLSYEITGVTFSNAVIERYGDSDIYAVAASVNIGGSYSSVLYTFDLSSGTPVFVDSGTITSTLLQGNSLVYVEDTEFFALFSDAWAGNSPYLRTLRVYPGGTMEPNCLVDSQLIVRADLNTAGKCIEYSHYTGVEHVLLLGSRIESASGSDDTRVIVCKIDGSGNITVSSSVVFPPTYNNGYIPYMGISLKELSHGNILLGTDSVWALSHSYGSSGGEDPYITTFTLDLSSNVITIVEQLKISNSNSGGVGFGGLTCVDSVNGNIWALTWYNKDPDTLDVSTVEINRMTGDIGNIIKNADFTGNNITQSGPSNLLGLSTGDLYGVIANAPVGGGTAWMNYVSDDGDFSEYNDFGPTAYGGIGWGLLSYECLDPAIGNNYVVCTSLITSFSSYIDLRIIRFLNTTTPQMLTYQPTDIDSTSCTGRGHIIDTGGDDPTYRGFVWNLTGTPTTSDDGTYETGTFGTGYYELEVSSLPPNQTIYMRAFATNDLGVGYGNQVEFVSHAYPQVYTLGVTHVGSVTATAYGHITSVGGSALSEMGFVYSTSGTPTTSDTKITHLPLVTPSAQWYDNLTGLNDSTLYYIRAYAINSYSTGYGEVLEFNTIPIYNNVTLSFSFDPVYILPPSSPGTIVDASPYGNNASYILAEMTDGITVWATSLLASGGDFYPDKGDTELPNKWVVPPQTGMTQQGSATSLPLYDIFEEAGDQLNMEPAILYIMMVLSMAMGIGFLVFLLIGNILISIIVMIVMLAGFFSTGVMPLWILIFFAAFALGIIYVARQT